MAETGKKIKYIFPILKHNITVLIKECLVLKLVTICDWLDINNMKKSFI